MATEATGTSQDVWFVYDGACPICNMAASALQIRKTVGALHLVNAREDKNHPLLAEINARNLNLDDGMVLKFQNNFYHGKDALHMMALLGSPHGWFNRMNAVLFRSPAVARWCYPAMRGARNLLIRLKGAGKINNLCRQSAEPIFKAVFAEHWESLPPVMKKHYAVRPCSDDFVKAEGQLDIRISPFMCLMSRLTGLLLAHSGNNIPVTVIFKSGRNSRVLHFDRIFHFPDHGDVHFQSCMEPISDNILVEFMGFGIGWKLAYQWDGEKVILQHRGYVWRIAGFLVPVPLSLLIGRGHAEEVPLTTDSFRMWTHTRHPLFGKALAYAGEFSITEVSCAPLS